MDRDTPQDISLLDEVKIQARVLVPVLKALRQELGTEKANRVVAEALRGWAREVAREVGAGTVGSPREKWAAMTAAGMPRIGGDINVDWIRQDPDRVEFNVTGCRYAQFFRDLGEPELGGVLLCETDFHIADVGAPEVELERTQTIMQGAKYCDFRYKLK
jgi:hypothetical protein